MDQLTESCFDRIVDSHSTRMPPDHDELYRINQDMFELKSEHSRMPVVSLGWNCKTPIRRSESARHDLLILRYFRYHEPYLQKLWRSNLVTSIFSATSNLVGIPCSPTSSTLPRLHQEHKTQASSDWMRPVCVYACTQPRQFWADSVVLRTIA